LLQIARSSLSLLFTDRGEESVARLVPDEIEDELHVGRPCFVINQLRRSLFQDVFVVPENGFVRGIFRN
jgi:hypothetical protein